MCCAKALFELHPCVLRHICSKECSAYAGYRVIDLHTDPDGMLQQWRNSLAKDDHCVAKATAKEEATFGLSCKEDSQGERAKAVSVRASGSCFVADLF